MKKLLFIVLSLLSVTTFAATRRDWETMDKHCNADKSKCYFVRVQHHQICDWYKPAPNMSAEFHCVDQF